LVFSHSNITALSAYSILALYKSSIFNGEPFINIIFSNPNIIYAATGWVMNSNIGNAGVYKSTDFGNTWTMLNTNMPLTGNIQRVKIAIAPSNNNYIYALCVDLVGGL
jgi:hypothetical protein